MIEVRYSAVCDYCGEEWFPYYSETEAEESALESGWKIGLDMWLKCYKCVEDKDEDDE